MLSDDSKQNSKAKNAFTIQLSEIKQQRDQLTHDL